jgi:hypothetical protein
MSDPVLAHLINRLTSDIEFLHSQSYITLQAKNQILDKLPKLSNSSSVPPRSPSPTDNAINRIGTIYLTGASSPIISKVTSSFSSNGGRVSYNPPNLPQPQNQSNVSATPPKRHVPPPPMPQAPPPPPVQDNSKYCKALWDYQVRSCLFLSPEPRS